MHRIGLHGESATDRPATIIDHYDGLASRYDADRFGNSYGRYLDAQERGLLRRWLVPVQDGLILDLACGTGRLLEFATHGRDASQAMVRIAAGRHADKALSCGLAGDLNDLEVRFDAIFCLHLFMHLPSPEIERILDACFARLKSGGLFVFDVPSSSRRRLTRFRPVDWHAGTALSGRDVVALCGDRWLLRRSCGVLFLPIHRLPGAVRRHVRRFDDLLGMSPFKWWASYVFYCLERRP